MEVTVVKAMSSGLSIAEYIRIGLLKLVQHFGTMLRLTKTAFKQLNIF